MTSVEKEEKPEWAEVVVNHLDSVGEDVNYKMHMNFTTVACTWDTLQKQKKGPLNYYKQ